MFLVQCHLICKLILLFLLSFIFCQQINIADEILTINWNSGKSFIIKIPGHSDDKLKVGGRGCV